jgi:hypothetical protein
VGAAGKYAITGTALKSLFGQMNNMDAFSRHKQFMALYKQAVPAPPVRQQYIDMVKRCGLPVKVARAASAKPVV